jgi:hypothetical protein
MGWLRTGKGVWRGEAGSVEVAESEGGGGR